MPKLKSDLDARSGAIVLHYVGPGIVSDVPADNLSANTLARVAWVRLGPERPSSPADVPSAAVAKIRDELIATGNYAVASEE